MAASLGRSPRRHPACRPHPHNWPPAGAAHANRGDWRSPGAGGRARAAAWAGAGCGCQGGPSCSAGARSALYGCTPRRAGAAVCGTVAARTCDRDGHLAAHVPTQQGITAAGSLCVREGGGRGGDSTLKGGCTPSLVCIRCQWFGGGLTSPDQARPAVLVGRSAPPTPSEARPISCSMMSIVAPVGSSTRLVKTRCACCWLRRCTYSLRRGGGGRCRTSRPRPTPKCCTMQSVSAGRCSPRFRLAHRPAQKDERQQDHQVAWDWPLALRLGRDRHSCSRLVVGWLGLHPAIWTVHDRLVLAWGRVTHWGAHLVSTFPAGPTVTGHRPAAAPGDRSHWLPDPTVGSASVGVVRPDPDPDAVYIGDQAAGGILDATC